MSADAATQRFFIATGVTTGLSRTADRIRDSITCMTSLFCDELGFKRVTDLGLNPTIQEMRTGLRRFCQNVASTDIVVLYHTGHADLVGGSHRLWMGDTEDEYASTLKTSELAELMLAGTNISEAVIILDACFAGQGGAEALLDGMRSSGGTTSQTLAVITSSHPREQVRAGDFARLFSEAVRHPATGGYEPEYLTLSAITGHINLNPTRQQWQTVSYSVLFGISDPPIFPNPRCDPNVRGLDVFTQLQAKDATNARVTSSPIFFRVHEAFKLLQKPPGAL